MEQMDARGLSCPEPAIMAREALAQPGADEVEVLVDSVTSRDNVLRVGRQMGWEGSAQEKDDGSFVILFKKRSG